MFRCIKCGQLLNEGFAIKNGRKCSRDCGGDLMAATVERFLRVNVDLLPQPIAVTATRLDDTLASSGDLIATLFQFKDCFEASIKFLGAVLLAEYIRSPIATRERTEELAKKLVRPTLGVWVNEVVRNLSHWLHESDAPLACAVSALFVEPGKGEKLADTPLRTHCKDFVTYRNEALGHGAQRPDWRYREDLANWLPVLADLLDGIAGLQPHQLHLVTGVNQSQAWMGLRPAMSAMPGSFPRELVGHFVMIAPDETTVDLDPYLSHLLAGSQEFRLHYYDSIYHFKRTRKEAEVLEYDEGDKQARTEPMVGLLRAFGEDVLAGAVDRHLARMAIIDDQVMVSGKLIEAHASIVGRRTILERVRDFLQTEESGVLILEGQPGKGKTALVAHMIDEVFGQHVPRPVHFFYRRTSGIRNPDQCVRSLYHALLAEHDIVEAEESRRQNAPEEVAVKLANLLAAEIAPRLKPERPQILFIDALDEADGNAFQRIPENLPKGVFVIATSRPVPDRVTLAPRSNCRFCDLDDPALAEEDRRDGLEYVTRELADCGLPPETLDEIARLGAGNFLVLKLLCRHLRNAESARIDGFLHRFATDNREDRLGFLYEEFWKRMVDGLSEGRSEELAKTAGILVCTLAPVTFEILAVALKMNRTSLEMSLGRLSQYLTEIRLFEDGVEGTYFRLYHETFADFLRSKPAIDRKKSRKQLADACRQWADIPPGYGQTYALRFGPRHLLEDERASDAADLLLDIGFLEAKAQAGMIFELAADLQAVSASASLTPVQRGRLELIEEAIRRDIEFLSSRPGAIFQSLWNICWWHDSPKAARHYGLGSFWSRFWVRRVAIGTQSFLICNIVFHAWMFAGAGLFAWLGAFDIAASWVGISIALAVAEKWLSRRRSRKFATLTWRQSKDADWLPWERPGPIHQLLEAWRRDKTRMDPSFRWFRAVRPPVLGLGMALRAVFRDRYNGINCVAYSPDGTVLAGGCQDGKVRVWDRASGREIACLKGKGQMRGIVFLNRTRLASASRSDVQIWNLPSGSDGRAFNASTESIARSPSGDRLATGDVAGGVTIWDVSTGQKLLQWSAHSESVSALAFFPDGRKLVSVSLDGTACVWSAHDGAQFLMLPKHPDKIHAVAVASDGARIATASEDCLVRIWNARSGVPLRELKDHHMGLRSVAFAADGGRIATASRDGSLTVWDSHRGNTCFHVCRANGSPIEQMALSPDQEGRWMASASMDGAVRLWDTFRNPCFLNLIGHSTFAISLCFAPDGKTLAVGSIDKTIRFIDVATGLQRRCVTMPQKPFVIRYSPGGASIAVGFLEGSVGLVDSRTGRLLNVLEGDGFPTLCIAFSSDERWLAAASLSHWIVVWEISTKREVGRFDTSTVGTVDLAFSQDADVLLAATDDGIVRQWAFETGKCLELGRIGNALRSPVFDGICGIRREASDVWLPPGQHWTVDVTGRIVACLSDTYLTLAKLEPSSAPPIVARLRTVGERVWAPWPIMGMFFLFSGSIRSLRDCDYLVEFDDGDWGWISLDLAIDFAVKPGTSVLARRATSDNFEPGIIHQIDGDRIRVGFEDGDSEKIPAVRVQIPCPIDGF
jgi:WD40 repeat protein